MSYSDTQAKNQTLWFFVSLILQGVFFLPIPAVLMFYYVAPIIVLVITLLLYFANIIAGMGGSGMHCTFFFCSKCYSPLDHVACFSYLRYR